MRVALLYAILPNAYGQVARPSSGAVPLVVARHDKAVSFNEPTLKAILERATQIVCNQRRGYFPAERHCPIEFRLDIFLRNEHPGLPEFSNPTNHLLLPISAVDALFKLDNSHTFRKIWIVRRISDCPGDPPEGYPPSASTMETKGCAELGGNTIVIAFDPEIAPRGSRNFQAFNHRSWINRQARRVAHELGHIAKLPDVFPNVDTPKEVAAAMTARLMYYSEDPRGAQLTPEECKNFSALSGLTPKE